MYFILIGYIMIFAYVIDLFRRKSPVPGIIIKRNQLNKFLSVVGTILIIVGYVSLFWIYKWWVVVLLIISIRLQVILVAPIIVFIKVKIFKDNY